MRWTLWAIGAVLVLAAWLGLPVVATAGDWTGTARIGETVEANDNPQLQPNSPGGAVGSITNLSLEAVDEWPTLRWEIGTNLGFNKFWGPGAVNSLDGVKGGVVHTTLDKTTVLTDYHAAFSGSVLPASVSQVLDSGITNANTTSMTYSGDGGLKHQVNELNAIGLSVAGTSESFTDNGSPNSASARLTPNSYLTAGQSWIHNVSPRTDLTVRREHGMVHSGRWCHRPQQQQRERKFDGADSDPAFGAIEFLRRRRRECGSHHGNLGFDVNWFHCQCPVGLRARPDDGGGICFARSCTERAWIPTGAHPGWLHGRTPNK